MYPRKYFKVKPIKCNFQKEQAEIDKCHLSQLDLKAYHDSDLSRDLHNCRSVSSSVNEVNGVAIDWISKKNISFRTLKRF